MIVIARHSLECFNLKDTSLLPMHWYKLRQAWRRITLPSVWSLSIFTHPCAIKIRNVYLFFFLKLYIILLWGYFLKTLCLYIKKNVYILVFFCLFVCCISSLSTFSLISTVTFTAEVLQIYTHARRLRPWGSEDSLACHTYRRIGIMF